MSVDRWFQADVPSDEVQSFRIGREGQIHPSAGHRRGGRLQIQVPQQVRKLSEACPDE